MLPGGSVWNLVDFIPDELQAAAAGRGGWSYSPTGVLTGATQIEALGYHQDTNRVIAIDQQPKAWNAVTGIVYTGTPTIPGSPPVFHRGKVILTNSDGTSTLTYIDSTNTIGSLSGAPTGKICAVYKDHAIVANSSANTNRVWFSAAGDPTTWDTSFGWWDTTGAVVGLATLTNAILVFHSNSVERLRGTTPPPGSDMVLEPFMDVGCIDPFSIAYWNQNAIFASPLGIFMTNGTSYVDLTEAAQMKTYWLSLLGGDSSGYRVAGGVYRDHYIVSLNNGTTLIDCLCVSLINRTMWRFTNVHGSSFFHGQFADPTDANATPKEELYMGQWNAGRIVRLSTMWSPSATVKQDADGTNPAPIIETGSFRGYDRLHRRWILSMGQQKWRFVYCDYDLRDAATDNPTITLSYALTPGGAYTALTGGTLPETTDYTRKRRTIGATLGGAKRSNMMELKLAVNGPYATCNVYTLEGDWSPIDIGRL